MVLPRSVLASVVLLANMTAAEAVVLDPPHVTETLLLNIPNKRLDTSQFGSFVLSETGIGFVVVTSSGTPSPSLLATANIGSSEIPSLFGRASASVDYAVEIVGPPGAVPVLVGVAGFANGIANDGASFALQSSWRLFDTASSSGTLAGDTINSGQLGGTFSQAFGETFDLILAVNHVYGVTLLADAGAAATLAGSHATAEASVDPIFSFGPGVDPSLYSFNFSPGIGNVRSPTPVGVPAPSTLVLLSTALFFLVRLRRPAHLCSR